MKKIILLFLAAFTVSCSDTDPAAIPLNQTEPKLATSIIYNDGWTRTFDLRYDAHYRLAKMVEHDEGSDLGTVFTLTYDDNDRLILIDQMAPEFQQTVGFIYDGSGRVSSWIHNGETKPINYDQGIYAVPIGASSTFYAYDDMNDITMISNGNPASFHYDETKKGAFRNVVGNYQLLSVFMNGIFTRFGIKKALLSVTSTSPLPRYFWSYTNTYDDEGYITGFTSLRGDGNQAWATINYNN
jgi:hypothetical protein